MALWCPNREHYEIVAEASSHDHQLITYLWGGCLTWAPSPWCDIVAVPKNIIFRVILGWKCMERKGKGIGNEWKVGVYGSVLPPTAAPRGCRIHPWPHNPRTQEREGERRGREGIGLERGREVRGCRLWWCLLFLLLIPHSLSLFNFGKIMMVRMQEMRGRVCLGN